MYIAEVPLGIEWIHWIPTPTSGDRVGGFWPTFTYIRCRGRYHLLSMGCTSFYRRRKTWNRTSSFGYRGQSVNNTNTIKGNLIDSASLLLFLIDFCEVWPSTSTVAADEAQLTHRPLWGLVERLDFLGVGWLTGVDEKLDFLSFFFIKSYKVEAKTFPQDVLLEVFSFLPSEV